MKSRMIARILYLVILVHSQQLFAGGNTLQLDITDSTKYHSVKWTPQQFPIVWHLSSDGYPGSGIDNNQLTTEIEQVFDTWSSLNPVILQFTNGGEINENTVGIDGINLLTFTDQDYLFPSGVSAYAVNYTFSQEKTITDTDNDMDGDGVRDLPNGVYPAGTIYESDIVFNGSLGYSISGNDGTVDVQGTALHEIGHLLGLSHSVIDDAVMYPFLSPDISSARLLKTDDIAHISHLYSLDAIIGSSISGRVINGYTSEAVIGAHVYVIDPNNSSNTVGAYSLQNGEYFIPGVSKGYVAIEPLNGNPAAKDPARINEYIKDTFDIDFIPEFYDANESNIETDPLSAYLIDTEVAPGAGVYEAKVGIDITTNTSAPPGVGMVLKSGLNIFSYPVQTLDGFSAFDLLQAFGDETEINSIDRYNSDNGLYERVFWVNGSPSGVNFSINRGEAYLVHMQVNKNVTFEGVQDCPPVNTKAGFNLIGVPCPPTGYSAFDLLESLGGSAVSIKRYDTDTSEFLTALAVINGIPTGDDFSIDNGVGYIVEMLANKDELLLDGGNQTFPAYISGISPGRAVTGSRVTISGMGFSEELTANEVLFNDSRAAVNAANVNTLNVTVPNTATTGQVTVASGGATSNPIDFIVEPRVITEEDVTGKDIIDGQTVQGELSNNAEKDRYTFVATKGSYVTATALSVIPSVPDLMLFLEGPSGEILAYDDNSAGGSNPKINRFKLLRTGRYTLIVTSAINSGSGQYTLDLNLDNVPPIKDISVLSGDSQNGLMGTQLKNPLELYITGPDGHAIAGIPVTLTTDNDSVAVNDLSTAASFQFVSNASGIVVLSIALPNLSGEYSIDIHIPGYPVKTITASSLPSLPATVEVSGNNQTCNSTGCTVGQTVTNPYQLKFLDSGGSPVGGITTTFEVVSGSGSLLEGVGVDKQTVKLISDANGIVKVSHKLGKNIVDSHGNKVRQIVAATSNIESHEVKLFEPVVKAATPVKVDSRKTGAIRMTMGTALLNVINLQVQDEYGNPVPGVPISYAPVGELELIKGSIDGVELPSMVTNADGVFVGTLLAPFNASPVTFFNGVHQAVEAGEIRLGSSGVTPTIDEFGARIKPPYKLLIMASGIAAPHEVNIDVDMGPNLVILTQDGGLDINEKQWVGKDFDKPIIMKMISYQRMDRCNNLIDTGSGITDGDQGDWRDETFTVDGIRSWSYFGIDATYRVAREDNFDDLTLTLSPTISSQPASKTLKVSTDISYEDRGAFLSTYIEPVNVYSGNAGGRISVTAVTDSFTKIYEPDTACLLNPGEYFGNIQYPSGVDIGVQGPAFDSDTTIPPLINFIPLTVVSPTITMTINDALIAEPVDDPYPGIRSTSGVDISSVKATLNNNNIFDGSADMTPLNAYPNFIEVKAGGVTVTSLQDQMLGLLSPVSLEIKYQPTASELNAGGVNTVEVSQAKDRLGNALAAPVTYEFTAP